MNIKHDGEDNTQNIKFIIKIKKTKFVSIHFHNMKEG